MGILLYFLKICVDLPHWNAQSWTFCAFKAMAVLGTKHISIVCVRESNYCTYLLI